MFATFSLAALLLAAPQTATMQDRSEPFCIADEMFRVDRQHNLADATRICKERYGWNDEETTLGVQVGRAVAQMMRSREEARAAGVDLEMLDTIRDGLDARQTALFGWEGEPRELPTEIMTRILDDLHARGLNDDQLRKATMVVVLGATATNAIRVFIVKRGYVTR